MADVHLEVHPSVRDVLRHAKAGFPMLSVSLIGTEQERFSADLAAANKADKDSNITILWFDVARWPNLVNMANNTAITAMEPSKDASPFGEAEDAGFDEHSVIHAIEWLVAQSAARKKALDEEVDEVPNRIALVMANTQRYFAVDGMYDRTNLLCQTLRNAYMLMKEVGNSIVFVGPSAPDNPMIHRMVTVMKTALPTVDELKELVRDTWEGADGLGKLPEDTLIRCSDALRGLTWSEAEDVVALLASEAEDGADNPDTATMLAIKEGIINKIPGLEMLVPRDVDKLEYIIGLDHAIDVLKSTLTGKPKHPKARVKGYIFDGLAGTAKSALGRAIGSFIARAVLRWNPKNSQGSLVGQSEQNVQEVFRIAEATGAVIIVDEADSAFAGTESSGVTDSGVMKGIAGALQTFMQENDNCIFIFTTNDLSKIPGPMKRGGRIDEIFWFGYPPRKDIERMFTEVWCPYFGYELAKGELAKLNLDKFVGADVEALVRKAVGRGKRLGEINFAPSSTVMGCDLDHWKRAAHGTVDATTGKVMIWNGKDLIPAGQPGQVDVAGLLENSEIEISGKGGRKISRKNNGNDPGNN